MEYYATAVVPTRSYRPRDKGHVEAGVKVVTNWVIHYLEGRVFTSPDELNVAVAVQVDAINGRTPFRGEPRSRRDWFTEHEQGELIGLPERRWEPVIWRKAKVHRDWHIQLDTIKYSVPSRFAGLSVDVRVIGEQIDVLAGGEIIATHQTGPRRNGYVTDPEHAPAHAESVSGLWTRGYFLRQAAKVGPGTVTALTRLLDGKVIEAQGYRSCMNILELGKRGSRVLLEQACRGLVDEDPHRQITYTAVKNRLTALRADLDAARHHRLHRDRHRVAGGRRRAGAPGHQPRAPGRRRRVQPRRAPISRRPDGRRPLMLDQHLTTDDMPLFTRLRMTAFGKR